MDHRIENKNKNKNNKTALSGWPKNVPLWQYFVFPLSCVLGFLVCDWLSPPFVLNSNSKKTKNTSFVLILFWSEGAYLLTALVCLALSGLGWVVVRQFKSKTKLIDWVFGIWIAVFLLFVLFYGELLGWTRAALYVMLFVRGWTLLVLGLSFHFYPLGAGLIVPFVTFDLFVYDALVGETIMHFFS
jgi:hypothetical protein